MFPEDRKAPKLSSVKRHNAALKRAIAKQEKILLAMVEQKNLTSKLQDLTDFNAGRIDGKPEDFLPIRISKEEAMRQEALRRENERLGTRY